MVIILNILYDNREHTYIDTNGTLKRIYVPSGTETAMSSHFILRRSSVTIELTLSSQAHLEIVAGVTYP